MNDEKGGGSDETELRRMLAEHARGKPFTFNPDSGAVDRIVSALAMRKRKTGFAYCPCRVVTGNPEKDKDIVCPCAYHEEEVARQGHCHCQLFVSPEFSSAGEGMSGVRGL